VSTPSGRLPRFGPVDDGANRAESGAARVEQGAQRVRSHGAFRWLAGMGLISRAVVYLVLGALIVEIAAKGHASSQADSQGAFAELGRQPGGPEVLSLLALGLLAYATWRFVETISRRPQGQRVSGWTRAGWLTAGTLYVALSVSVVRLLTGSRPNQGPAQHPSSLAATVLRLPFGPAWLGLIATATVAGGSSLIAWGAVHDYGDSLQTGRMRPLVRNIARWSGILGNAARGVAVLLVASSFFASAASHDPSRAKALDSALQGLANAVPGDLLLGLVGLGFLIFAIHSTVEARFRRV
jgi:hypothetical protein